MPERNPVRRRVPVTSGRRRSRPPRRTRSPHGRTLTPLRRAARPPKSIRLLRRSSSEPILWTVRFFSGSDEESIGEGRANRVFGENMFLPRPHTLTDIFSPMLLLSPSSSPRNSLEGSLYKEEAKVVMNVTVEGSTGPVRAMVRLGASIEEAIGVVVEKYGKEGRSPRLDQEAVTSFQLHHSYFSLQSLNKNDKIGEVGGRSFYLRKSSSGGSSSGLRGRDVMATGEEIEHLNASPSSVVPSHLFVSFITRRIHKIGRRTKKLWNVLGCMACG